MYKHRCHLQRWCYISRISYVILIFVFSRNPERRILSIISMSHGQPMPTANLEIREMLITSAAMVKLTIFWRLHRKWGEVWMVFFFSPVIVAFDDHVHTSLGLTAHLKCHAPAMFWLYELLKSWSDPPTDEEIQIASAQKVLDPQTASRYLDKLAKASGDLDAAFAHKKVQALLCSSLLSST